MKKICTFLKQKGNVILQFIEAGNEPIGIMKTNISLDSDNMDKIESEIQSHFGVQLTDTQKYFIKNNNKGVLNFQ